jgi:ubiquinone/menaquinone biosynthesis C-methylase UbiE
MRNYRCLHSTAASHSSAPPLATASGQDDNNGSRYENYSEAAQVYDGIRYAGGVEVTLGAWSGGSHSKPLHEQDVLDIGCGTGNYAAAVAPHVGSLTCMDGSPAMLAKCQEKLQDGSVNFVQGLLPTLPFEDDSFDSAMCNLVIHHIEDDSTRPTWANTLALMKEAKRVLRPGGTLCFNHITPQQVDGYWFLTYVPECRERWKSTLVPTEQMYSLLSEAGMSDVRRTTPMDYALFRPMESYLDPRGPLDPGWRKSTSVRKALAPE